MTNLNDSGPGSLRQAIQAKGPRTILFRVSGNIDLKSNLIIKEPFVTVAGQSAPGDGVCLRNYELVIDDTHDVVVRYLRVRPGDVSPGERDAISIVDSQNVILDHCSASWSIDELLSTTKSKNVTVQWSLITEALHRSHHHKGNHGYGSLIQGDGISYHHNLYAHNRSRNPRPASGLIDFRNNVIYDWDGMAGYAERNTHRLNYVANDLKPGPSTKSGRTHAYHTGGPDTSVFFSGNTLEGTVDSDEILNLRKGGQRSDTEFDVAPVRTDPADVARDHVLASAGCSFPRRDAVDTRIVHQFRTGTGRHIDSQTEVGGWPHLNSAEAPTDSDQDGMPDEWEQSYALNSSDPTDALRLNPNGYTHLELYLDSLILPASSETP